MKTILMGMLAETPLHPGSGRNMGVIDLPVAREAATDYPFVPGSGLKGAMKDKARLQLEEAAVEKRFGLPDQAGDWLVSDARLLLLPVRSLSGAYRWTTCPYLLERLKRDARRSGLKFDFDIPTVKKGEVLSQDKGVLYLEERRFKPRLYNTTKIEKAIGQLLYHGESRERLSTQLAILNDDDFAWFVRYGLPIQARNVLDIETKESKNLWYEETLPPDTTLYAMIAARNDAAHQGVSDLFSAQDPYLQVGGNETVGQGWLAIQMPAGGQS